jgi:hypothetical protein
MEPLKMSNPKERAVGKQQHKIQSLMTEDWTLLKPEEEA